VNGNPYQLIRTEVLDVVPETPTISTFRLRPEAELPFVAGQFVAVAVPGVGEAPFTPSSSAARHDELSVSIMRVGKVTERIHALRAGDTIGLRGPFGSCYPLDDFRDRDVVVVGGGCGFAPLRSLMYALFDRSHEFRSLHFRGGCRNPEELLYREEMRGWSNRDDLDIVLTVDEGGDGWDGPVGVVTTILDGLDVDIATAVAIICGPPIMMKFSTKKVIDLGFRDDSIFLSMEKNMSCGIGKCGHCRLGTHYCCKDGPVFRYSEIKDLAGIWE